MFALPHAIGHVRHHGHRRLGGFLNLREIRATRIVLRRFGDQ